MSTDCSYYKNYRIILKNFDLLKPLKINAKNYSMSCERRVCLRGKKVNVNITRFLEKSGLALNYNTALEH